MYSLMVRDLGRLVRRRRRGDGDFSLTARLLMNETVPEGEGVAGQGYM